MLLIAIAAVVGLGVYVYEVGSIGKLRAAALSALWAFGAVCMSTIAILAIGGILAV